MLVANFKKTAFNIYSSDGKIIAMDFVSIWRVARKIPSTDRKYKEPLLFTPIEEVSVESEDSITGFGDISSQLSFECYYINYMLHLCSVRYFNLAHG